MTPVVSRSQSGPISNAWPLCLAGSKNPVPSPTIRDPTVWRGQACSPVLLVLSVNAFVPAGLPVSRRRLSASKGQHCDKTASAHVVRIVAPAFRMMTEDEPDLAVPSQQPATRLLRLSRNASVVGVLFHRSRMAYTCQLRAQDPLPDTDTFSILGDGPVTRSRVGWKAASRNHHSPMSPGGKGIQVQGRRLTATSRIHPDRNKRKLRQRQPS